jgi:hypothetical protein
MMPTKSNNDRGTKPQAVSYIAEGLLDYGKRPAGQGRDGHRLLTEGYEAGIGPARLLMKTVAESTFLAPDLDPLGLDLFLIYFSILGVGMTEPVEGWVNRAGERCEQVGLPELGRLLRMHARDESNHHLMLIEDTRVLEERWNARGLPPLDWEGLRAQPLSPGVLRYRRLHENVIAGISPFCELAIEFEIERLSVDLGARFLEHCQHVLGPSILAGLSFLKEHVTLDQGHTNFNEGEMVNLLDLRPGCLSELLASGSEALESYADFVRDCHGLALATARKNR